MLSSAIIYSSIKHVESNESKNKSKTALKRALLDDYRRITKTEDLTQPTTETAKRLLEQHCHTLPLYTSVLILFFVI